MKQQQDGRFLTMRFTPAGESQLRGLAPRWNRLMGSHEAGKCRKESKVPLFILFKTCLLRRLLSFVAVDAPAVLSARDGSTGINIQKVLCLKTVY
ncbi:hypothetical protein [Pontibacter mucosus]|uniref:hypothetical protein n=1 Tax=Pontibacter mucosus TaxID=1649266 RepID=UPI000D362138|nr:hypothetical protein [Pontibacter mucosus]